jgi:hypothetical protein
MPREGQAGCNRALVDQRCKRKDIYRHYIAQGPFFEAREIINISMMRGFWSEF